MSSVFPASAIWTNKDCIVKWSGACVAPVSIHFSHRQTAAKDCYFGGYSYRHVESTFSREVVHVRCRKCPACSYALQMSWAERAIREYQAAKLSILGTLTFSEQFFAEKWRELQVEDMNQAWENGLQDVFYHRSLDVVPEFDERARKIELGFLNRELTLYFKRLREKGLSIRYMATTEFGRKKGRPHFHFVMHFSDRSEADFPVIAEVLKAQWRHVGFSTFRVVRDEAGCRYAAKYIGKFGDVDGRGVTGGVRIRASTRYGANEASSSSLKNEKEVSPPPGAEVLTWEEGPPSAKPTPRSGVSRRTRETGASIPTDLLGYRDTRAGEPVSPRERLNDGDYASLAEYGAGCDPPGHSEAPAAARSKRRAGGPRRTRKRIH